MASTREVAQNLAFLLWQDNVDRDRWAEHLSPVLGCDEARAWELLTVGSPSGDEIGRASARWHISADLLANTNLIDNSTVDVLTENLRRLLASVPHGDKQLIAAAAGVNPATLSTWEGGAHQPRPENRRRLLASLGVWPDADLDEEPLFLSPLPLTVYERRRWLKGRIDTLPPGLLADLFPALQRLLAS